jgi:hypothetical protein
VTSFFQPHQLDYDWRFDANSQRQFVDEAAGSRRVVLLGCPTLMYALDRQVVDGVLLERNPNHRATNSFIVHHCDLREIAVPKFPNKFDLAIVDAPWYLDDLFSWLNVALSAIDFEKPILFVLWPGHIRPTAQEEHQIIWAALENIGEIELLGSVSYDTPYFEKITLETAGQANAGRSGLLVKLTKRRDQRLVSKVALGQGVWKRFQIDKAQFAIKIEIDPNATGEATSDPLALAREPFVLPSTSRREPSLRDINLWTSENVVAELENPAEFAFGLARGAYSHIRFLKGLCKGESNFSENAQVMVWVHQI